MSYYDQFKVTVPEGISGDWKVEKYEVSTQEASFGMLRSMVSACERGRYVPAGTYKGLWRGNTIVMSDTPDEIRDHLPAIRAANGHCLVGGLGLGMVVAAMARKPDVTKVTVIEKSPDVIALVGPHLKSLFGDKVEIIESDLLTWTPPKGSKYGVAWFDIWDNMCGDNLPQMATLKRRYARRTSWKGCWGESQTKAYVQRSRRNRSGWGW
jgi:hypothetical protein